MDLHRIWKFLMWYFKNFNFSWVIPTWNNPNASPIPHTRGERCLAFRLGPGGAQVRPEWCPDPVHAIAICRPLPARRAGTCALEPDRDRKVVHFEDDPGCAPCTSFRFYNLGAGWVVGTAGIAGTATQAGLSCACTGRYPDKCPHRHLPCA